MSADRTRLPHPPLLTEFPFNYALEHQAPGDISSTAAQRAAYLRFTQMGDPAADDVVTMFHHMPPGSGRRMFEHALEHGIDTVDDAPPQLVRLFAEVDTIPWWVDHEQLDRACRVIARTGVIAGFTSLAMLGLMGGYLASRVVKPLVATGNLDTMATRRLAETTAWACDVTTPGGLARFAAGTKGTVRVRLMHALVRAGMTRSPRWQHEWDHPLNQSQLAGTVMLFSLANLQGSQALGVMFTSEERAAVHHLWRYVAYLLGVAPELTASTELDYWKLLWLQADYEFRSPDQDSVRLAQALAKAIGPSVIGDGRDPLSRVARFAVTGFMCAYASLILGRRSAATLALPSSAFFRTVVVTVAIAIRALEYPRRAIPGATRLRERLGQRTRLALMQRMMRLHRGDRAFDRHDGLAAASPHPRRLHSLSA